MAPKPWISIPNMKIYLETKFRPNRRIFVFWRPFLIQNGCHSKPTMNINSQLHNLLGNQISPKSEDFCIWRPLCTLVTMATAAILKFFNPPIAATHYGGYSHKVLCRFVFVLCLVCPMLPVSMCCVLLFCLSSSCVLCLMFSVSLDSSFIVLAFCVVASVLFVFVRCLVSSVFCVSGFYLHCFSFLCCNFCFVCLRSVSCV